VGKVGDAVEAKRSSEIFFWKERVGEDEVASAGAASVRPDMLTRALP
jgi:hypothetical protein